jgi:hypothetical protein
MRWGGGAAAVAPDTSGCGSRGCTVGCQPFFRELRASPPKFTGFSGGRFSTGGDKLAPETRTRTVRGNLEARPWSGPSVRLSLLQLPLVVPCCSVPERLPDQERDPGHPGGQHPTLQNTCPASHSRSRGGGGWRPVQNCRCSSSSSFIATDATISPSSPAPQAPAPGEGSRNPVLRPDMQGNIGMT